MGVTAEPIVLNRLFLAESNSPYFGWGTIYPDAGRRVERELADEI